MIDQKDFQQEPPESYEALEEGFERVFDELDSLIASNPKLKDKNFFLDVQLVESIQYEGQQHVELRERDEDVYNL